MAECSQEEQTRTRTVVGEDGTEKVRIGYFGSDYELLRVSDQDPTHFIQAY